MSKLTPTAKRLSSRGYEMGSSMMPPSSPIYVPSTVASVEEWWTSLREVSRASPTLLQEGSRENRISGTCGPTPSESSARWDRSTSYWRTSRASSPEGMGEPWSGSFPKRGMTVSGELYLLPKQEPLISGRGGGVWPSPSRWVQDENLETLRRRRIREKAKGRNGNGFGLTLDTAVKMWTTPKARDSRSPGGVSEHQRHTPDLPIQAGGKLNPQWVEWLMGVPIGWTDLEPLATGSFRQWQRGFLRRISKEGALVPTSMEATTGTPSPEDQLGA